MHTRKFRFIDPSTRTETNEELAQGVDEAEALVMKAFQRALNQTVSEMNTEIRKIAAAREMFSEVSDELPDPMFLREGVHRVLIRLSLTFPKLAEAIAKTDQNNPEGFDCLEEVVAHIPVSEN